MTKENLLSSAEKLQQEIKRVNERNQNIIKAHNNGQSEQQIMDTFEINEDTLIGVLKKAKRDGLLKTDVVKIEDTKPSERPKPKPPVLKENEIEKPKSKGRPKKESVAVVEVEKTEPRVEPITGNAFEPIQGDPLSNVTHGPRPFLAKAVDEVIESFRSEQEKRVEEVYKQGVNKLLSKEVDEFIKPYQQLVKEERRQKEKLQFELNWTQKELHERDLEIARLQKQIERFDHSQDLVIGLMRNTIALVDQAEEYRTEGKQ